MDYINLKYISTANVNGFMFDIVTTVHFLDVVFPLLNILRKLL